MRPVTQTASQWSERTPPPSALSRIERHLLATEIQRARPALLVGVAYWMLGIPVDLIAREMIDGGPLWLILVTRIGGCALFATTTAWCLYRALDTPRLTRTMLIVMFPMAAIVHTVLAAAIGGLASPYVMGMAIILICQAVAVAMPWKKAMALSLLTTAIYPAGMLIACVVSPEIATQLADERTRNTFILESLVVLAAGDVAALASHGIWSLRRELAESRSIGRYRLQSRLGRGGMGEVWRATDRATGREVALKILMPRVEDTDPRAIRATVERFEREIGTTVRLDHPHVVRILDWGATDGGIWYYAMEILEGSDLARRVEEHGPLPLHVAVPLAVQAARALGAAHRAGIVHRDVKPANLFVVERDNRIEVKVLDFGVARVEEDPGLTKTGALVGTPSYMSPEVLCGGRANAQSDVWSLAATLHFALTGKRPREASAEGSSELPSDLAAVLETALAADPAVRPGDGDALANALEATLSC